MAAESFLHDMPVPVTTIRTRERKELRAERLLHYCGRAEVLHVREFATLETQLCEFPQQLHDDLIDAVGHAWMTWPRRCLGSGAG